MRCKISYILNKVKMRIYKKQKWASQRNTALNFHSKSWTLKYQKINHLFIIMRVVQCLNCQVPTMYSKCLLEFKFIFIRTKNKLNNLKILISTYHHQVALTNFQQKINKTKFKAIIYLQTRIYKIQTMIKTDQIQIKVLINFKKVNFKQKMKILKAYSST